MQLSDNETDDISLEMWCEPERRLSQEEKCVASAVAEYRHQVMDCGEEGYSSRLLAIQNQVQSILDESNKPKVPLKMVTGYGRFTGESQTALQAKQSEPLPNPNPRLNTRSAGPYYSKRPQEQPVSPVKDRWEAPSALPWQGMGSTAYAPTQIQRRGPSRLVAPPKPKNLRVGGAPELRPISHERSPTSPGDDWEANFSRRFPSLSGLEMERDRAPDQAA